MAIEPTQRFIVSTIEASTGDGGWQASGSFANDQDEAEYGRRVEIYGHLEGGGSWQDEKKLALRGSTLPKTLTFDRKQSSTTIVVATSHVFLVNAGLQGIYFTEQASPANPHQITNLNLGKIVEHIVEQHTNISTQTAGGWVDTSNIDTINSTSVDVYTVRQSNSIWQTIESIASNEFYVRYFTKDDKLIYEPHPQFEAVLPTPTLSLTQTDIVAQPEVTFRDDVQVDQVQAYSLTDTGAILTAFYPTNIGTEGRRQKFTNLRCNSQARLNLLAERTYKFLNRETNVRITLPGAWGIYLEMYDRIQITYSGTDRNGVSISWNEKKFYISNIVVSRVGNFGATTELALEEENV